MARARNSPAAPGLTEQCLAIVNDLAIKGQTIAQQDSAAAALRSRQPDALAQRGFDIGLAADGGDTEHGPAKQAIRDSLNPGEQAGFSAGESFALDATKRSKWRATVHSPQKGSNCE